jgi:dTDP-4-dehydrorhamnose reductase
MPFGVEAQDEMRILIIGSSGMLGFEVCDQLAKNNHEICMMDLVNTYAKGTAPNFYPVDITDLEKTYTTISKINPDLVINTVAVSNVDECERNPESAYRVNSLGVRNVALACQRFDAVMCHISTDYVFSGENTPADGYVESDVTNPQNVYGKSKQLGEFYVKHLLNKFCIVRTSYLFGKRKHNFASWVIQSVNERKKIKVVRDQYGSPTYTKDLAKAIARLVEKPFYGIYHLTNSGGASRQEFVEEIFKVLGKSTEVEIVDGDKVFFAPRPRDSRLKNYMWHLEGFKPLRPWQDALKEFIKEP